MMPLINLLPWRPLRRRYRLKLWAGSLLFGALLITGLMWLWARPLAIKVNGQRSQASQLEAQAAALKALLLRQQTRLQDNQRRLAVLQAEAGRRGSVSRWEEGLYTLALGVPENSWLRSVSWQNERAIVSGVAGDARELEQLEAVLADLPGAFEVKPGELRDEKHKGLVFTFILNAAGGKHAE